MPRTRRARTGYNAEGSTSVIPMCLQQSGPSRDAATIRAVSRDSSSRGRRRRIRSMAMQGASIDAGGTGECQLGGDTYPQLSPHAG